MERTVRLTAAFTREDIQLARRVWAIQQYNREGGAPRMRGSEDCIYLLGLLLCAG